MFLVGYTTRLLTGELSEESGAGAEEEGIWKDFEAALVMLLRDILRYF